MFNFNLKIQDRKIAHVDADAFFASVEQALNPFLKGKPLLIGDPNGRNGIVSTASYEAKRLGIKSGMPMFQAMKLCPDAKICAGNFKAYRQYSREMYKIFSKYSPKVEMLSIDEAYIDFSHLKNTELINYIREMLMEVPKKLKISVSAGLSSSKTVSKIASGLFKPHKFTHIPYGYEERFLSEISIGEICGVGKKTFDYLQKKGISKTGDLSKLSCDEVLQKFGVSMIPLWKRSKGVDNSEVSSEFVLPKSISKERTYYEDVYNKDFVLDELKNMLEIIIRKMERYSMKAKILSIKLRYKEKNTGMEYFRDLGANFNLGYFSSSLDDFYPYLRRLFFSNTEDRRPIRLAGVGLSSLLERYNLSLF